MGFRADLEGIFKKRFSDFSERLTVVEASCEIVPDALPELCEIEGLFSSRPTRDHMILTFADDADEKMVFSEDIIEQIDRYEEFRAKSKLSDLITIKLCIEKHLVDEHFSVFDFRSFVEDLLGLSPEEFLKAFAFLHKSQEVVFFDLLDTDCFFSTKTMIFASPNKKMIPPNFPRLNRIQACRETSYFYDFVIYPLLPDDFYIVYDFDDNPLKEIFNRMTTLLSMCYLASTATIRDGMMHVQVSGQRNLEYSYVVKECKYNLQLYSIYNWIFTDGNPIDKALLARNLLSIHCKFSDIIDIDEKTLASIQSNYNLYLKEKLNQYLDLKNKLAEFICDIVSKTGDYSTMLLDKFMNNLVAMLGFLFTVLIANIVSSQPLNNIFTYDITRILDVILAGSLVYLVISFFETRHKIHKAEHSYYDLKENYKSVLSQIDIDEAFKNDNVINKMLKSTTWGLIGFSILWVACIIGLFIALEKVSPYPLFK